MSEISSPLPTSIDSGLLQGDRIRLEPLGSHHESELAEVARDADIWRFLTSDGSSPEAMHRYVGAALQDYMNGEALPFVVRAEADGRIIGMTRLKDIAREHKKALIGSWFVPRAWGSGANTESKLMLLRYAFESLQCLRVEFQTDSRNLRSRAALRAMGAAQEGVLRSYLITATGRRRDTVVFSVLIEEWPQVKQRLINRLTRQRLKSVRTTTE